MQNTFITTLCVFTCCFGLSCGDDDLGELSSSTPSSTSSTPQETTPSTPTSLIDHTLWVEHTAEQDPWADERPDVVDCPTAARRVEDGSFEILTGFCNYLSITQNTLVPIRTGDTVTVVARHLDLIDEDNPETQSNAHIAVRVDDWDVWDTSIPIPNPPQFYTPSATAPRTFDAGTPISIHLHNHGFNTWYVVSISVRGAQTNESP